MTRWLARGLATAAVAWCVGIGVWLWLTPVGDNGSRSFADVSLLGPLPLIIPVLIGGLGAWALWQGRVMPAAVATGILLVFVVLAGFSIGPAYLPAAAALIWATIALADR